MPKKRILIIGAGPGGLAAAMLLAKSGLDVTVLEKQPRVGGRTSTIEADGFRFDLGPTFFHYPQVLSEIFAATGYDLRREVNLIPVDPLYRAIEPDLRILRTRLDRALERFSAVDLVDRPRILLGILRWAGLTREKRGRENKHPSQ